MGNTQTEQNEKAAQENGNTLRVSLDVQKAAQEYGKDQ